MKGKLNRTSGYYLKFNNSFTNPIHIDSIVAAFYNTAYSYVFRSYKLYICMHIYPLGDELASSTCRIIHACTTSAIDWNNNDDLRQLELHLLVPRNLIPNHYFAKFHGRHIAWYRVRNAIMGRIILNMILKYYGITCTQFNVEIINCNLL